MIPKWLIEATELGNKRIVAVCSAEFAETSNLASIARFAGYSANRSKAGVLVQFRNVLSHMSGAVIAPPFCRIYRNEFDALRCCEKANLADCLLLLAHIRLYQRYSPDGNTYSNFLNRIAANIGLSPRKVKSASNVLEQAGLIYRSSCARYKDSNDTWHTEVSVFADATSNNVSAEIVAAKARLNEWRLRPRQTKVGEGLATEKLLTTDL